MLLDLIAPPLCAACSGRLESGAAGLCRGCLTSLPWLRGPRCLRCALPRHRGSCPAAGAAFARAWAPLAYKGSARQLVAALKFQGRTPLAGLMAAQLAANLPRDLREAPLPVVPVPAHAARRRRRGYDAAELLAAQFAQRTDRELVPCLRRRDRSAPHKRASRQARRTGRLRIEAVAPPPRAALLVDDVYTTGATLDACAAALTQAGCEWVAAVSYARAL